jgi:hypothetical protein
MPDTAPSTPDLFFETANAYQRSAALAAALELDVFTAIDDGASTVSEIAARCKASERGIRILCDYLVLADFLIKDGTQGPYRATPETCPSARPAIWAGCWSSSTRPVFEPTSIASPKRCAAAP